MAQSQPTAPASSPGRRDDFLEVRRRADGGAVLVLRGAWVTARWRELPRALPVAAETVAALDIAQLTALDSAGASRLAALLGAQRLQALAAALPAERRALLERVAASLAAAGSPPAPAPRDLFAPLVALGRTTSRGLAHLRLLVGFLGLVLVRLGIALLTPHRLRLTATVHQMQAAGLEAVPIVTLLSFLVGAVVAFLGATVLQVFGAGIYTVDLVAYSFLREFGVLLAAILLAGRTASSFAAQLGTMKVNEEIDALETLGLDPVEVLVIPRVVALLVVFPLLSFLAMAAGLAGGAAVALVELAVSPARFLAIVEEVPVRHFWVGMGKAPLFAFTIALIGCLEGFKVTGSASSVGDRTTSAVVQAIFFVILFDALAALFCMEMGW
ncbi:MAG: hypothetical protein KatS3mg124_2398 [Porticoccaceae bacterium]|nr:MAG: hypothetical protein KatS3mg124_2398 [Porticoccaceae bacterium]